MWREQAIREYKREVDRLTVNKEVVEQLPDMPLETAYALEHCVVGYIPWDRERYNQIEAILEGHGWGWVGEHHNNDGSRATTFEKDGHELIVYMDPNREGSSCKLVQTGTKETPVYEVRCAP